MIIPTRPSEILAKANTTASFQAKHAPKSHKDNADTQPQQADVGPSHQGEKESGEKEERKVGEKEADKGQRQARPKQPKPKPAPKAKPSPKTKGGKEASVQKNEAPAQGRVVTKEDYGWACPACTYINQPKVAKCEICNGPRGQ